MLISTIARLAGRGGDPVIGLQTNFGGGKTHTMLALYHLGGAAEAGYRPEDLQGLRPLFDAAGVDTLGPVQRAVFVGTHKGASEAMHVEGGARNPDPVGLPRVAARRMESSRDHRGLGARRDESRLGATDPDPAKSCTVPHPHGRGGRIRAPAARTFSTTRSTRSSSR